METNFTTTGVLGLVLTIILLGIRYFLNRDQEKKAKRDAIAKEIDNASNASDILHVSGKLRDK